MHDQTCCVRRCVDMQNKDKHLSLPIFLVWRKRQVPPGLDFTNKDEPCNPQFGTVFYVQHTVIDTVCFSDSAVFTCVA